MDDKMKPVVNSYSEILSYSTKLSLSERDSEFEKAVKDESRKKWLRDAFMAITVDIPTKIKEYISELTSLREQNKNKQRSIQILEELIQLCEDIDHADTFYRLEGLDVLYSTLENCDEETSQKICILIAAILQNNAQMQINMFNKCDFFLRYLQNNLSRHKLVKFILLLLSALCRNVDSICEKIILFFESSKIHLIILKTNQSAHTKLFSLLQSLQITNSEYGKRLIDVEFIVNLPTFNLDSNSIFLLSRIFLNLGECFFINLTGDADVKSHLKELFDVISAAEDDFSHCFPNLTSKYLI